MRARKNPQPFTLENLLREMKPGRGYSPEVISLIFGVTGDAARGMLLGAVMLGEMRESVARRGIRAAFYVPARGPTRIASRRVGPLESTVGILTGYTAELWRLHDLCMASRGQCHLMRYPPARLALTPHVKGIGDVSDLRRNAMEDAFKEMLPDLAEQQPEVTGGGASRNRGSPSSNRYSPLLVSHPDRPSA